MKKILAVSLLLNAALLLMVVFQKNAPMAKAASCTSINGDVDGNGAIEVTDVVQILNYAFVGTLEELIPLCSSSGSECSLPATGQTKCYDIAGAEIDCASADYPGQDGLYQAGCPMSDRFVDNGDGTVTDTCTGLMWQKDTADIDESGSIGDEDRINWQDALKYCDDLDFAGHQDWRLPNVREFQSIVDYGRYGPAIDPVLGRCRIGTGRPLPAQAAPATPGSCPSAAASSASAAPQGQSLLCPGRA